MQARIPKSAGIVLSLGAVLLWGSHLWPQEFLPWHTCALLSTAALIVWIYNQRRYRALADTPRSRIASAAQGYIELRGIGRALEGVQIYAPLTGLPCLWYRLVVEERNHDNEWRTVSRDESQNCFILRDDSGSCVVDPEGAEIHVRLRDERQEGDTRSTQWLLISGTEITVLGEFVTRNHLIERGSVHNEVRDTLADRKKTGEAKRFDLDKNGELSQQEWELARAAARREVLKARQEAALDPQQNTDLHVMQKPQDGRLYLIGDRPSEALAQRYHWYARGALVAALLLGIFAGYLHQKP